MLVRSVAAILDRDLRTLAREVEAYPDERQLWQPVPGCRIPRGRSRSTSPETCDTTWVHSSAARATCVIARRKFSRRDISRAQLLAEIEAARSEVGRTLAGLKDESLPHRYPEAITDHHVETEEYLVHLVSHFTYHLGQLDTHRRIVTGSTAGVGAVRPAELGSARPA